jgi:hypothetical protein
VQSERPLQWAAVVAPVREVTLLGSAELAFWRQRLRAAGLTPAAVEGRARIMLCAASARFKGITFRELSLSVLVSRQADGRAVDGAYLLHAFNSIRLFAWFERTLFATPYFPADVQLRTELPLSISAAPTGQSPLMATMGPGPRNPIRSGEEGFTGPLFLPPRRTGVDAERFFVAEISGLTQVFAFDPARDTLALSPVNAPEAFRWLAESGIQGHEWHIRTAGRHAKSKTYRRKARDPWAA